jgi:hypothetical protein
MAVELHAFITRLRVEEVSLLHVLLYLHMWGRGIVQTG